MAARVVGQLTRESAVGDGDVAVEDTVLAAGARHGALHRARVLVMVLTEVDVCGV